MKLFATALTATLTLWAAASAAATIDITVAQVGSDVVFSYAGALDLTGASVDTAGANIAAFAAPQTASGVGAIGFGGGPGDSLDVTSMPAFGTGDFVSGSPTGPGFGVFTNDRLGLPLGYTSNTPISGTLTISGETLASLGLIAGVYQTGTLPSGDFVRLTVPEPASAVLCLCAAAALASGRRRRS